MDAGLIQLHDEHQAAGVWYSEDEVVQYMPSLMKATFDINWRPLRVIIHPASCFTVAAGPDHIPGELVRVWNVGKVGSSNVRQWHFLIQLEAGYEVVAGQGGAAVTLESGGTPIGMLVASLQKDATKAVVTPLHHIHASLNSVLPVEQKVQLCHCHQCPVSVSASHSQHATKQIRNERVYCTSCKQLLQLRLHTGTAVGGTLDGCCSDQMRQTSERIRAGLLSPLLCSSDPYEQPTSCALWNKQAVADSSSSGSGSVGKASKVVAAAMENDEKHEQGLRQVSEVH